MHCQTNFFSPCWPSLLLPLLLSWLSFVVVMEDFVFDDVVVLVTVMFLHLLRSVCVFFPSIVVALLPLQVQWSDAVKEILWPKSFIAYVAQFWSWKRETEREDACARACVYACVCACMRACVHTRAHICVCVCVCVCVCALCVHARLSFLFVGQRESVSLKCFIWNAFRIRWNL